MELFPALAVEGDVARKKVLRGLPSLPKFRPFKADEPKEEILVRMLRQIARDHQASDSQPFYALRDVARHFRLSLSIAARAYSRLEQEGLLNRLRGSKAVLLGKSNSRSLTVKGFVGMPASLACFMTLQDYRTFFLLTPRALRARGFRQRDGVLR